MPCSRAQLETTGRSQSVSGTMICLLVLSCLCSLQCVLCLFIGAKDTNMLEGVPVQVSHQLTRSVGRQLQARVVIASVSSMQVM